MANPIRIDKDIPMEMRDGVVLRADIYQPDDSQKHPAILYRTPYNKQIRNTSATDFLDDIDAAQAGYVVIIQDIRGRWASDGEWRVDNLYTYEGPDGYDSVEWVASQPWCDGNVGMAGGSYLAILQWLTAMQNPPHLKAIAPWIGQASPEIEISRTGGVPFLHAGTNWIVLAAVDVLNKLWSQGEDVSEMRKVIFPTIFNPEQVYNYLPLKDIPLTRFEGMRDWWNVWLNPNPDRGFMDRTRYQYEKITVPCFHISGWYDIYNWGTLDNFKIMRERGGSQVARDNQHLLMGPWIHAVQFPGYYGDIHFGPSAGAIWAQISNRNLAFFDKYLRGRDIDLPMVRYFVMGRNRWYNADAWPLPQTKWQRFFLHSQGRANTAQGDGLLNRDEPGAEPTDTFVYNPHSPVPSVGGRTLAEIPIVPGPKEQSFVEQRNDVLCYTTEELDEEVEVTGPLEVHLFAATSAVDTDFTAKLVNVYPDGRAYNVAEGIMRARGRKSIFEPELLKPGEINEYVINLGMTSQLFREGHRIRIDISSSNFPIYDRNMNTGNPIGEDTEGIPATQTIRHQSGFTSYIDLPVIPSKGSH
jgi:putative CocE/NonD family hydrolase